MTSEDTRWLKIAVFVVVVLAIFWGCTTLTSNDNDGPSPAEIARAHEDGAITLCENLVRDRVGAAEFRTSVTTTGTNYVVTGNADLPGRSVPFRCEGGWHSDSGGGEVRVRLVDIG